MKKLNFGFTLIEVLIVIAMIGMIIGLLLPNYNQLRMESRDQSRKAGVKALVEALELYKINHNPPQYPASIPGLNALTPIPWIESGITYMNRAPIDPLYATNPNMYFYRYIRVDSQSYFVGVCLEDKTDADGRTSPHPVFDNNYCDSDLWYYKTEP
jgi:type II secretion system protein G